MSEPTPTPGEPTDPTLQKFAHNPMSARVPEKVARGVTATGTLAYFGPNEFVIDFVQVISKPAHLAARVVMSPAVAEQFHAVLRENYGRYTSQFGTAPAMPKPPAGERPRTPQEIYEDLKISDDALSGVYANNVMVGHTPAEFGMDFITSFIPHAAVSARVYMAAPRIPPLIESLGQLIVQYKRQFTPAPGGIVPPPPPPPSGFGTAPGIPGFPPPPSH